MAESESRKENGEEASEKEERLQYVPGRVKHLALSNTNPLGKEFVGIRTHISKKERKAERYKERERG